MAIEYLGLSEINGPLVVLEGVQNAAYDEIVEMTVAGNLHKIGRIIEIYGDKAIIQVFEGTDGMAPAQYPYKAYGPSYGDRGFRGDAGAYL